jgi:tetratricopeptide (TPR) repeat protein
MDQATAMELIRQAGRAYEPGNYGEASELIGRVLAGRPGWPAMGHALQTRAIIASETGDVEAAQRYWQEFAIESALHKYPEEPRALGLFNWAYTLRLLERYQDALMQYELAAVIMRRVGSLHLVKCLHNLAWTALLLGNTDQAEQAITEAEGLAVAPDDAGNQMLCEAYLAHLVGRDDDAQTLCLNLIDQTATDNAQRSHAAWLLGQIALGQIDLAGASEWADQAAVYAQGDPSEYRLLHDVQSLRGAISVAAGTTQTA